MTPGDSSLHMGEAKAQRGQATSQGHTATEGRARTQTQIRLMPESKPKTTGPVNSGAPPGASLSTPLFPSHFSGLCRFTNLQPFPIGLSRSKPHPGDPQRAASSPSPPYSHSWCPASQDTSEFSGRCPDPFCLPAFAAAVPMPGMHPPLPPLNWCTDVPGRHLPPRLGEIPLIGSLSPSSVSRRNQFVSPSQLPWVWYESVS